MSVRRQCLDVHCTAMMTGLLMSRFESQAMSLVANIVAEKQNGTKRRVCDGIHHYLLYMNSSPSLSHPSPCELIVHGYLWY